MKTAEAEGAYLEFDLDGQTLAEVESLAVKSNVTLFEMCVLLLEERIAVSGDQSSRE